MIGDALPQVDHVYRATCSGCGRKIVLVHKTKTHPQGTRLFRHMKHDGRVCYGVAVRGTIAERKSRKVKVSA